MPSHAIGDAAVAALRAEGVRTDAILRGGDRLGIYFAESGASQRPSTVIYDRAHSSISDIDPARDRLGGACCDGATWFHVTGITPALGPEPARCVADALAARERRSATSASI